LGYINAEDAAPLFKTFYGLELESIEDQSKLTDSQVIRVMAQQMKELQYGYKTLVATNTQMMRLGSDAD
jgi:hypothetical protein